jgi:hypothetical protein
MKITRGIIGSEDSHIKCSGYLESNGKDFMAFYKDTIPEVI